MPSSLAQHVRTIATKNLQEQGKEPTPEAVESQGRWLLALWHANNARDLTMKDIAEFFLTGVKPIVSVDAECEDLTNPDEDDFGAAIVDFLNSL